MQKKIRFKILITTLPILIISAIVTYLISAESSERMLKNQVELKLTSSTEKIMMRLEDLIDSIEETTEDYSSFIGATYQYVTLEQYKELFQDAIATREYMVRFGVWFEPYVISDSEKYMSTYAVINEQEIERMEPYVPKICAGRALDYFSEDFYENCKLGTESVFTNVHYDKLMNRYLLTYATPIFNVDGEFIGCVTADFDADLLHDLIMNTNDKEVNLSVIDENGTYLGHNDDNLIVERENIKKSKNQDLIRIADTILTNEKGTLKYSEKENEYVLVYDTVKKYGWKLLYSIPQSVLEKPIRQITILSAITILISVTTMSIAIVVVTNKFVHRPLSLLMSELEKITVNSYNIEVPKELLDSHDEFSEIGATLEEMKISLKEYQTDLEIRNKMLYENEKSYKLLNEYNTAIIAAFPIHMFIFDRDGECTDFQGKAHFQSRTREFYIGKSITQILGDNATHLLEILETIELNDGVLNERISCYVEDKLEYFDITITLCRENEILIISKPITETVNQMNEIRYLSYHDQVTGIGNRRQYEEMLKHNVEEQEFPLSIIISDVNGLKLINDSFGHQEGDNLLIKFVNALKESVEDEECVTRIGGDEFAIVLPRTTNHDAKKIVECIMNQCVKKSIHGIVVSAAFGVGTMQQKEESISDIIKNAEDAMYVQKLYNATDKDKTVEIINNTLQEKNPREQLHSDRVAVLCERTAKYLGMSIAEQSMLKTAGLLHDIGKIGIPEELLNKPGNLTEDEFESIKKHPEIGYRIIKSSGKMKEISNCILSHHEKLDGSGYPRGLKGDEISLEARIIAIADAYDAMTSERSYRKGMGKEAAIAELNRCKGTQFDSKVVEIFIEHVVREEEA